MTKDLKFTRQVKRELKGGIIYLKTENSFSTTHAFSAPLGKLSKGVTFDGKTCVRCVVVASRKEYELFRQKGLFWSPGIHTRVTWID